MPRILNAITRPSAADQARFWSKVQKSEGCWLWTATRLPKGYGQFKLAGQMRPAHKVAYAIEHGETPAGLFICHTCDTPACVRPDHLFPGTNAQNQQDKGAKGRHHLQNGYRPPVVVNPECAARGERIAQAKLTAAQVIEIRQLHREGKTAQELAEQFGVKPLNVRSIITRRTWKHL